MRGNPSWFPVLFTDLHSWWLVSTSKRWKAVILQTKPKQNATYSVNSNVNSAVKKKASNSGEVHLHLSEGWVTFDGNPLESNLAGVANQPKHRFSVQPSQLT